MTGEKRGDEQLLVELRFQLAVTRAMLGTLDLDRILYIILSGITHGEGLNFNRAFLFLAEEGRRELRASFAVGPASGAEAHQIWQAIDRQHLDLASLLDAHEAAVADSQAQLIMRRLSSFAAPLRVEPPPFDEHEQAADLATLVCWCAASKQPFLSNSLRVFYEPGPGEPLIFQHVACVPIIAEDRTLGVILVDNAYNGRMIEAGEMRSLSTVANLAAIAIDRAFLHGRLKEMASRDGLTGVFNRGHYEQALSEAIAAARRAGRSLGLLVIDIDHFKVCNDTFGHECGDQVLRDLAAILNAAVRSEDLIARYGGEEFVALLSSGATRDGASRVAEDIRRTVAGAGLGGLAVGSVTVSIGAAVLEHHQLSGETGADLFRRADVALYAAKQGGRNRVSVAPGSA